MIRVNSMGGECYGQWGYDLADHIASGDALGSRPQSRLDIGRGWWRNEMGIR